LFPVTVRLKASPPATAVAGLSPVIAGTGLGATIMNVCAVDVPPPGVGLNTVTERVWAVAMSAAVMAAVSCVAETYVVVRLEPFQRTTEVGTKLVPVTVRLKLGPPAVADVGFSPVVAGKGLLMVKVRAPEVPPPGVGLKTRTEAVPAVAMSATPIAARSCVAET
jgi:hypothetical protein